MLHYWLFVCFLSLPSTSSFWHGDFWEWLILNFKPGEINGSSCLTFTIRTSSPQVLSQWPQKTKQALWKAGLLFFAFCPSEHPDTNKWTSGAVSYYLRFQTRNQSTWWHEGLPETQSVHVFPFLFIFNKQQICKINNESVRLTEECTQDYLSNLEICRTGIHYFFFFHFTFYERQDINIESRMSHLYICMDKYCTSLACVI